MSTNTACAQSASCNAQSVRYLKPSTTINVPGPSFALPTLTFKSRLKLDVTDRSKPCISVSQSEMVQTHQKCATSKSVPHPQNTSFKSTLNPLDETMFLAQHGYIEANTIRDTLQGELLLARSIKLGCDVAIKKTEKRLHNERISLQNGVNIVVEENIVKEALILRHLTVDNNANNDYIVGFIEFLESDDAFYLIMEHVGNMNLAAFAQKVHLLIAQKRMRHKYWKKIVKWLFWQLTTIIHWLHNDIHCCHLDLKLENIMIVNGNFVENKADGTCTVDPNIKLKVVDFGLSEIFKHPNRTDNTGEDNDFECFKHGMTHKHHLCAPRVFLEELYDARKADMWSLGVILYELSTGIEPYTSAIDRDFRRIQKKKIKQLIGFRDKTKYVNAKMINLIALLLNTEESERIDSNAILQNEWLRAYYQKYKVQIERKSKLQLLRNKALKKKMNVFPYYAH